MERLTLNLVPAGVMPEAHASQFDNGRVIRFNIRNGEEAYTLTGAETITAEIAKPDGSREVISIPNTSSNYVDLTTEEDTCSVPGLYGCEIKITDGAEIIGSQNFILKVEADPYADENIHVETVGPADICTFETTLAEPLQSVIVNIEATGGNGTPDNPNPIVGYTEANITRCGVNLFDGDNLIIANYPYSSMTFDKATYLKAGTYTVSISNVDNASSWRFGYRFFNSDGTIITSAITNGLVSFTAGTALLDVYDSNQTCLQASDNTETSVKFTLTKDTYIVGCISNGNVGASTTLDYQIETGNTATAYHAYNEQTYTIAFGQTVYGGVLDVTRGKLTVTWKGVDMGTLAWVKIGMGGGRSGFRATLPTMTPTPAATVKINALCEAYEIKNGNDVYLGNVGLAGWGVNTHDIAVYDDTLESGSGIDFQNAMDNIYLAYELATPFDIDLTPEVISAVVGTNNVFADCGQTTVKYLKAGE